MDWAVLLQIVTLVTVSLSTAFSAWLAYKHAELKSRLEAVTVRTDTVISQNMKQTDKLQRMEVTIDGHLAQLIEAKVAEGKLVGIAEEQARMIEKNSVAKQAHAEAARIVEARDVAKKKEDADLLTVSPPDEKIRER